MALTSSIHNLLILLLAVLVTDGVVAAAALSTDGLAILAFKFAVSSDPTHALDNWRDSDSDPCNWRGVTCGAGGGRVTGLTLTNLTIAGYLPSELSLLASLQTLVLPYNRLSGPIPAAITALTNLAALDLSHNLLSGAIPPGMSSLTLLSRLDLSANLLNGSLPASIASLPRLAGVLNLSHNLFSGHIPSAFGNIPVVVSLDLRRNNLSGEIPQVGSLINQGPTAFTGNPGLCGFPLKNDCPGSKQQPWVPDANPSLNPGAAAGSNPVAATQRRKLSATVFVLAAIVVAAIVSAVVLQWQIRRRCTTSSNGEVKDLRKEKDCTVISISDERRRGNEGEVFVTIDEGFALELEELLRASAYVVGKSRSGIVYKVVPSRGPAVAVRRLSEPDDSASGDGWRRRRAFEAEAAAIGRASHPNVARLRAYYYAPDEKLLIYDFLANGSLHSALHGGPLNQTVQSLLLPWAARLSIVQGAARGLAYLHECSPRRYVHGCIKSSKILLDDELRPYISGFGLARLVAGAHKLAHSKKLGAAAVALHNGAQSALAYIAPELRAPSGNAAAATQKGDVYAFGIVLLEAVTGRGPADGDGGMEVEAWVRRAFKEELPLSEVLHPALLGEVHAKKQVLAVFHVALGCTESDPELRPRMRAVAESLDRIG